MGKRIIIDADFSENAIDGNTAKAVQGYITTNSTSQYFGRIVTEVERELFPNVPKAISTRLHIPSNGICKISIVSKNANSVVEGLYSAFVASQTLIELVHRAVVPNIVDSAYPFSQERTGNDGIITITNNTGYDLYYYICFTNNASIADADVMPVSNYRVEFEIE